MIQAFISLFFSLFITNDNDNDVDDDDGDDADEDEDHFIAD